MASHLHARRLYHSAIISITEVQCRAPEGDCGGVEYATAHEIVLPRAGVFVKHWLSTSVVADSNTALFFTGGQPYRVSHPLPGGDECTVLTFHQDVLLDVLGRHEKKVWDRPESPFGLTHGPVPRTSLFLHHQLRRCLRGFEPGGLAIDELALELLRRVIDDAYRVRGRPPRKSKRTTAGIHRSCVEGAKAVLAGRFKSRLSLAEVARAVHCSPYHLSRIFRREVGIGLHQYLNRLRLGAALDRLADGTPNLTELAIHLGYSSHSHFSVAFRKEFGTSPSEFCGRARPGRLREMSKNLKD